MNTVPFTPRGCVLHKSHRPKPARLEEQHVLPLYLAALIGVKSTLKVKVCSDGHTDVHIAMNAMLVGASMPKGVGLAEKRLAMRGLDLFYEAGGRALSKHFPNPRG